MPAEKKKRDDGVGVVDAGARPLAPWSMQAALSLSREVWEAWGLAATSVKMLWKERLCTICVVPAPRGRCLCTHSSRTMAHARKEKRAVNDFHTMDEEWEWEWETGSADTAERQSQGQVRGQNGVGLLLATGAASGRRGLVLVAFAAASLSAPCGLWTARKRESLLGLKL